MKVVRDSHKTYVVVVDAERFEKFTVRRVANPRFRDVRERLVDEILLAVDSHHLVTEDGELIRDVFTESSESDKKN